MPSQQTQRQSHVPPQDPAQAIREGPPAASSYPSPDSLDVARQKGITASGEKGPGKAAKAIPNEWPFSNQLIQLQKQRFLGPHIV